MSSIPLAFYDNTRQSELHASLQSCERLLSQHMQSAIDIYGTHALGVIDLPPLGDAPIVGAQLRVAAVLLWCYEVEVAGVLPFVESLAKAVANNRVNLIIGDSAGLLMRFWKSPDHRFVQTERQALYDRLLFGGNETQFQSQFNRLVYALSDISREPNSILHLQVRAAQIAENLGMQLSQRATGIAGFAARDIVDQIRLALRVLNNPEINRALGGGSVWRILQHWGPIILGRPLDVETHIQRAQSGMMIINWIADASPNVTSKANQLHAGDSVVHAAETWRSTLQ